jgi:adenylate kinase
MKAFRGAEFLFSLNFWLKRKFLWPLFPSSRPRIIALLGGPGAGKGTVAGQLAPALKLTHISTGALIRKEIAQGTEFGKRVKDMVEKGQLIPDQMALDLLERALRAPENARGAILDGFPRSKGQAELLDKLLSSWGLSVEKAVWLELSEEDLVERLSLRRTCSNSACGRSYHLKFEPPKRDGICDACSSSLYQRKDDAPESIRERLVTYREESKPLRSYYQRTMGGALVFVNPTNAMTKEQVLAKVKAVVND